MKKIGLFVLTILFILPLGVKAETKPKVLKVTSTVEKTTIKYEGTTEDDVYAVMCKLYNSKNEEIDLLSSAVDTNKFNGKFEVKEKGEYKVACANYDGGEIKEATATVKESSKDKTNPDTYDSGILTYVIIAVVGIVGVVLLLLFYKKRKK